MKLYIPTILRLVLLLSAVLVARAYLVPAGESVVWIFGRYGR